MKVKLKEDYKPKMHYLTQEPLDYLEKGVEYTLIERRICSSYSYYCIEGFNQENGIPISFPSYAFEGGQEWFEKTNRDHYSKLRDSVYDNFSLSWCEEEVVVDGVKEFKKVYFEN